ncbi:MAG: hypothetical protein ACI9VS_001966 [Candidatus Binatia bacterium]|jgi:hypothetical protein
MTKRKLSIRFMGPLTVICLSLFCGSAASPRSHAADAEKTNKLSPPEWLKSYPFKQKKFSFVRLDYSNDQPNGRRGSGRWLTDFPDADIGLSAQLAKTLPIQVHPGGLVVKATASELKSQPFIYIAEPGGIHFSDEQVIALRAYLAGGGFIMLDDFWGESEWKNARHQIGRILPDAKPINLPLSHPLFHCVFDLKEKPQVCNVAQAIKSKTTGITWERHDAKEANYQAIFDKDGHMQVLFCHNTDLGDGWERETVSEYFRREFSLKKAYPMGINIVFYALTQGDNHPRAAGSRK